MTIAKIAFDGVGPRTYVPEGPYGAAGLAPFPSYDAGSVQEGDKEGEFVFLKLGVTGSLTMNQGDVLVWDDSFMAVQSLGVAAAGGNHPLGAGLGTFYLGGRVGDLSGGPFALPLFQFTFPQTGVYGVWAQRAGASLINAAAAATQASTLYCGTTAGQMAIASTVGTTQSVSNAWIAKNSFTFTATSATGSNVLTNVSTNQGLTIGQNISGAGVVPITTYITDIQGSTVVMSAAATAPGSGVTFTAKDLVTSGNFATASTVITGVPALPIIFPNQSIAGAGIPASTTITSITGVSPNFTINISQQTTAPGTGVALTAGGYQQARLWWPYILATQ